MDRREAIKRTSMAMGGMISAPTLAVILKGCSPARSLEWQPVLFSPEQAMLIEDVCERIIPTTDTPGAKAAGVPQFVETMINLVYKADAKERFMAGLSELESSVQEQFGKPFPQLTEDEQYEVLAPLNKASAEEALLTHREPRERNYYKPSFFRMLKELTLTGYYTSEIGATQELQYNDIPGNYDGCIPLEQLGGKTWAT